MRELMAMILEEEGYEVSTATDGLDALAQLRTVVPDLVISDLHMPRMSGIEFLSVVRRRFPAIPVMALSGSYDMDDGLASGAMADAFCPKGRIHPDALMRTISDLMHRPLRRPTNYRPCQPPRVQTARTGRDGNGVPTLLLTCTDCLRVFVLSSTSGFEIQETHCQFCMAPVRFIGEIMSEHLPAVIDGSGVASSTAA